jgi:Transposase DDE domain.
MDTKNLKVDCKSNQLISVLQEVLKGNMNLARIKFFGLFICALCKMQNVCFEKLATAFETDAKSGSSLRRIQRFIANYALNTDLIALLIFKMLPHKPPYQLSMDRTNWKFGETNINVLTLAIVYDGVAFPLLILMLDKRGNSDTPERVRIIDKYITLFGHDTIDCLLADREFVGEKWIAYLNRNKIRYYIRIRENFYIDDPRKGEKIKASVMFSDLKCGECRCLFRIYRVNGQLCYLSASKVKDKQGKPELQIIISFNLPQYSQKTYKKRWQIETCFKGLKSSGFNIENTHLTDLERIEKLFTIVMLAFAWAYIVGLFVNNNIKPIRILKHGRRAKSLIKYGLDFIARILLNTLAIDEINIFKFLSCT